MNGFAPAREKIIVKEIESVLIDQLAAELSVNRAVATILVSRNLTTREACLKFFKPDVTHFHDPFIFEGMEIATDRILLAITNHERIAVYGDYDVDGITSTTLMMRVLQALGAQCEYYLPNRMTEGYGISETGIRYISDNGVSLMITVDCGITADHELSLAKSLGIDCIVTDHHEPKETLPVALALINPKIHDCAYPDKVLAGVGVALKLCQALAIKSESGEELWRPYLDLVALGTAADIVPLTGENRIIARLGYAQLSQSSSAGLRALIDLQGLTGKNMNTSNVVFQLAPCINAVGRLGDPRRAVELLLTDDPELASVFALELKEANFERRALDSNVAEEAYAWVSENCNPETDFAIVIGKEDWHVGVIGIVASKLVERYHRPSILFSINEDGMARGSGRSIPGLHLLDALSDCSDILETFGGHAAAAGMCVKKENIERFRVRFNEVVRKRLTPEDLVPMVTADVELALESLTPKFHKILKEMEPFGPGNMRPVLLSRGLRHRFPPRLVGSKHLKMTLMQNGVVMDAIAFNLGDRLDEVYRSTSLVLAFSLDENEWNGKISLQMKVKGITV